MKSPMSRKQYRKALEHFGLTQARACWLFNGKTETSGRYWASQGAPYHVALLLTIMHRYRISPNKIEALGAKWRKK